MPKLGVLLQVNVLTQRIRHSISKGKWIKAGDSASSTTAFKRAQLRSSKHNCVQAGSTTPQW